MASKPVRSTRCRAASFSARYVLDEPFNAIDAKTVADLISVIKRWHGDKLTVMVVAHDLDLVRQHFPETLLLARAPIAWGETDKVLRAENLLRARHFDEAWHDDAPWCEPDAHDHTFKLGHDQHSHDDHSGHAHSGTKAKAG
jgi:zinc/manganese transport system ATP-binding protein